MVDEQKPERKKINGKANRRKGHDYERKWAKVFRDLGYNFCRTSREASKLLDNSRVDLAFIPFNLQCKNVATSFNYINEINAVTELLKKHFPPGDTQHKHPVIIAHKRGSDELIVMKAEEFINILTERKELLDKIKKLEDGNQN